MVGGECGVVKCEVTGGEGDKGWIVARARRLISFWNFDRQGNLDRGEGARGASGRMAPQVVTRRVRSTVRVRMHDSNHCSLNMNDCDDHKYADWSGAHTDRDGEYGILGLQTADGALRTAGGGEIVLCRCRCRCRTTSQSRHASSTAEDDDDGADEGDALCKPSNVHTPQLFCTAVCAWDNNKEADAGNGGGGSWHSYEPGQKKVSRRQVTTRTRNNSRGPHAG